jgi:hypothetical protein
MLLDEKKFINKKSLLNKEVIMLDIENG